MKNIRRFTKHLLIFLFILSVIISFCALIHFYGPREFSYYDDSWYNIESFVPETNITYNVLLDQHSHTIYSEGFLTVRQNIEWHKAMGFTAAVISDHNTLSNSEEIQQLAEEYKDEIIIIQGMEWTTRRVHLNFIGIHEWNLKIPVIPTNLEIQKAIDEVHRQNGVVTVNHLPNMEKYADNVPTRNELLDWGIDFFEIVNKHIFDYKTYELYMENSFSFGLITGTDMHSPQIKEGGKIYAWTALNTTTFTEEAIMDVLRTHKTKFITNQEGLVILGNYYKNAVYSVFRPFYIIGEGLENLYLRNQNTQRYTITTFLVYSFALFFFVELIIVFVNIVSFKRKSTNKHLNIVQRN